MCSGKAGSELVTLFSYLDWGSTLVVWGDFSVDKYSGCSYSLHLPLLLKQSHYVVLVGLKFFIYTQGGPQIFCNPPASASSMLRLWASATMARWVICLVCHFREDHRTVTLVLWFRISWCRINHEEAELINEQLQKTLYDRYWPNMASTTLCTINNGQSKIQ